MVQAPGEHGFAERFRDGGDDYEQMFRNFCCMRLLRSGDANTGKLDRRLYEL